MPNGLRRIFLDANILLYAVNPLLHDHSRAVAALSHYWTAGAELVTSTQDLREFMAVATGKFRQGRPQVLAAIAELRSTFVLVPETNSTFDFLTRLVANHEIAGI